MTALAAAGFAAGGLCALYRVVRGPSLADRVIGVEVALVSLAGGIGYALWTIATEMHVTNTSVLLTVLGVLIFLVGLVSDQISALRMDPRNRD